jgi:hypothetical protein
MAEKAYITSEVLKWARESARIILETSVAKVVNGTVLINKM